MFGIRERLKDQLCQLGVRWRGDVENAHCLREKGFGDGNDMPDFTQPAERGRGGDRRITRFSGDTTRNTGTRKPTPQRPGSDRSHRVGDRFQAKNLPELIDPVSLHANAVLLEVRRLPDPSYVARHAFRCNELCKDLSARLIREPGDDVGVITECHDVTVATNTTQPPRQRQGGETTHTSCQFVADLERHGQKLAVTR